MSPELKLSILFSAALLLSSFVFVSLMFHSMGTMGNLLAHLRNTFLAESKLRLEQYHSLLKQNRMRRLNKMEHERRQEALLAIPLVRNQPKPGK